MEIHKQYKRLIKLPGLMEVPQTCLLFKGQQGATPLGTSRAQLSCSVTSIILSLCVYGLNCLFQVTLNKTCHPVHCRSEKGGFEGMLGNSCSPSSPFKIAKYLKVSYEDFINDE